MAILRCGNSIRLNGEDPHTYISDTGQSSLPKSVTKYNRAVRDLRAMWHKYDTPESRLLAATCFQDLTSEP